MVKKSKQNKGVSASEKEFKKLSKKVEKEIKQVQGKGDFDVTKGTDISSGKDIKGNNSKGRKSSKEKVKKVSKSVIDMTREELIKAATSTAQHANKTLREYEKSKIEHLPTYHKLLEIGERHNLKTKSDRISRSFKNMPDYKLRDFITETKNTYTGKSVKKVTEKFSRQRTSMADMLRTKVNPKTYDVDSLVNMSDKKFIEFLNKMTAVRKEEPKLGSKEVAMRALDDLGYSLEDQAEEIALALQRNAEMKKRLEGRKVSEMNRNKRER
jgi:hypothetical protein